MIDLIAITTLNGIVFGLILFLVASGLTLSMGLMGYFNLAHGAIYAFSGAIGATVFIWAGNFLLAILVSMVTAGLIGVVIERGFLCRLAGVFMPQLLVTVGFIYVLDNINLWIWRGIPFAPITIPAPAGTTTLPFIAGEFPTYRILVIFIVLAVAIGFFYFDRSRLGALVRAGMDDSQMVEGMGINISKIHFIVFTASAFTVGFAAGLALPVFGSSSQAGFDVLIIALIVSVVGGMGSVLGAFVFALLAGLVTTFGKVFVPETSIFFLYGLMVIVLLFRPFGIFGK